MLYRYTAKDSKDFMMYLEAYQNSINRDNIYNNMSEHMKKFVQKNKVQNVNENSKSINELSK